MQDESIAEPNATTGGGGRRRGCIAARLRLCTNADAGHRKEGEYSQVST